MTANDSVCNRHEQILTYSSTIAKWALKSLDTQSLHSELVFENQMQTRVYGTQK